MNPPSSIFRALGLGVFSGLVGYIIGWVVLDGRPVADQGAPAAADGLSKATWKPQEFDRSINGLLQVEDKRSQREKLDALIAGLDRTQLPQALAMALRLEGEDRKQVVAALLFRWVELDPPAAIEQAKAFTSDIVRPSLWTELLTRWAEKDLTAALAWASTQPAGQRRREAVVCVAATLAKQDPAAAVKLLEPVVLNDAELTVLEKALGEWAARDFTAASAHALTVVNSRIQRAMFRALLESRSDTRLRETLDWVATLPDFGFRAETIPKLIKRWMGTDPMAALDYVVGLDLSMLRRDVLSQSFEQLAKESPEKARAVYAKLGSTADQELVINGLIHGSMQIDRDRTLEYVKGLPEGRPRTRALAEVAITLAPVDMAEAKNVIGLLPAGGDRRKAVGKIAKVLAETNFPAALNFSLSQQSPNGVDQYVYDGIAEDLLHTWLTNDKTAAVEWIRKLPSGDIKTSFACNALTNFDYGGPQKNLEFASTFDTAIYAEVAFCTASELLMRDFKAGSEWILKLPPGHVRERAIAGIPIYLTSENSPAVFAWLNQLSGADHDAAMSGMAYRSAHTIRGENPAQALEYAAKIGDSRRRFANLDNLAQQWLMSDKEAATTWIQNTSLIDQRTKQKLLEVPGK